jgi:hypothetical protein
VKIYRLFSTGADNDDWIHGVFSTRELAEAGRLRVAAHYDWPVSMCEIDEWEVDRPAPCECARHRPPGARHGEKHEIE